MFKIGDKVKIASNSHYTKTYTVLKVYPNGAVALRGIKNPSYPDQYLEWFLEELVPESVWNTPLYDAMSEN